jgi:hypothetical protein
MLDAGIADPDDEVRRLTMIAARGDVDGREAVVSKGLTDANPRVRLRSRADVPAGYPEDVV